MDLIGSGEDLCLFGRRTNLGLGLHEMINVFANKGKTKRVQSSVDTIAGVFLAFMILNKGGPRV